MFAAITGFRQLRDFALPTSKPDPNHPHAVILDNEKKTRILFPDRAEDSKTWPKNRSIGDIESMLRHNLFDKLLCLPRGSWILDAGCGNGKVIQLIETWFPGKFKLCGITTTQVESKNFPYFDELTYLYVPSDPVHPEDVASLQWLTDHADKFALILDTYGPATYADNPLEVMLFYNVALKPGGQVFSMSSMVAGDAENSCFGDHDTRQKIEQFFKNDLQTELKFTKEDILSVACAEGKVMTDLKVEMTIPLYSPDRQAWVKQFASAKDFYNHLYTLAVEKIGRVEKMPTKTGFQAGPYAIMPRRYVEGILKLEKQEETEITIGNKPSLTCLPNEYVTDIVDGMPKYKKLIQFIMNKYPDWCCPKDSCDEQKLQDQMAYEAALFRLMTRHQLKPNEAEKELRGLSPEEARYVSRGLTSNEVLRLLSPMTTIPIEVYCRFKGTKWDYPELIGELEQAKTWLTTLNQLEAIVKRIENAHFQSTGTPINVLSMVLLEMHKKVDEAGLLAGAYDSSPRGASGSFSSSGNFLMDVDGTLLRHFGISKGRSPNRKSEEDMSVLDASLSLRSK